MSKQNLVDEDQDAERWGWVLSTSKRRAFKYWVGTLKLQLLGSRLSWSYMISLAQKVSIYVLEQSVAPMRIEGEITDYLDRRESRFCKAWNASQSLQEPA